VAAEVRPEVSASAAVGEAAVYPGTYRPRIVHIDWGTVHHLIGRASHHAWRMLAKKYKMIRLKGKFNEHKQLTGELMRKWCWELVEGML